jgi:hypothetical protein
MGVQPSISTLRPSRSCRYRWEALAVTLIVKSGPSVGYAARLHLPPGHIQDGRELSHGERPLRCCRGQRPVQHHSGQISSIPVYDGGSLRVPSSKDDIPNGVLKIRGDHGVGACALEKLQALAAAREAAEEPRARTPRH